MEFKNVSTSTQVISVGANDHAPIAGQSKTTVPKFVSVDDLRGRQSSSRGPGSSK